MQIIPRHLPTRYGALIAVTLLACSFGAAAAHATEQLAPAPAPAKGATKGKPSPVPGGPMVTLTQAVHFFDAKGQDLVVGPGDYHVAVAGTSGLTLTPSDGTAPVTIEGQGGSLQPPEALSVTVNETEHHILFIGPHAHVVEVVGSPTGIHTRANQFWTAVVMGVESAKRASDRAYGEAHSSWRLNIVRGDGKQITPK
jgi:hypothetical protein